MTESDRTRWDDQHAAVGIPDAAHVRPPSRFADHAELFPSTGIALELACGNGTSAVWLAQRGLTVTGVDVSPVAIGRAATLADQAGVADRCRFVATDLDGGLPDGPAVDVLLCHMFRDPGLYPAMIDRLAPGGLIAISVLSEVGIDGDPGRFRARPGELTAAFAALEIDVAGERDGYAWLLARRPA